VILYAESSAVLAWLLGQAAEKLIAGEFAASVGVVASQLTLVECERALHRSVPQALTAREAAELRSRLVSRVQEWTVLSLSTAIVRGAKRRFPVEPIRTLGAIHLSSALSARNESPDTVLLSLDRRVRANGVALGFQVVPTDAELDAIQTTDA